METKLQLSFRQSWKINVYVYVYVAVGAAQKEV